MNRRRERKRKLLAFVDDLVSQTVKHVTTTLATPEAQAREIGMAIAHAMCKQYARTTMYVPLNISLENLQRNVAIWRKYGEDGPVRPDGSAGAKKYSPSRIEELAEEFRLTTQQIYNIVHDQHQAKVAERQGVLPGMDSSA